jgi:hypothetical protein
MNTSKKALIIMKFQYIVLWAVIGAIVSLLTIFLFIATSNLWFIIISGAGLINTVLAMLLGLYSEEPKLKQVKL